MREIVKWIVSRKVDSVILNDRYSSATADATARAVIPETDPAKVSRNALCANGLRRVQMNNARASSTGQHKFSALKSLGAIL